MKCCSAVMDSAPRGLARAYLVVKVVSRLRYTAWSSAVVGLLSVQNLDTLQRKMIRSFGGAKLTNVGPEWNREFEADYCIVEGFMSLLSRGGYSSDDSCRCRVGSICNLCDRVPEWLHRFVVQDMYEGVYPKGRRHWFTGVTDAIGEVSSWQRTWLCSCPSRRG
jgi:hypothetical protein